jgi:hypothetical protein
VFLTKYYSYAEIKKNGMGVACSTDVGEERCLLCFCGGKRMERDHLKDLSVDGRIILRDGAWTGLISLRIGTGGGLLRQW